MIYLLHDFDELCAASRASMCRTLLEETRKVLESLGQVPDTDPRRMKKKPAKRDAPPEGPRVVHVVDGEVVEPEPAEGGEGQGDDGIDRV